MDDRMRYDLMVKLSDFYMKNVRNHLEDFDKARKLSNVYSCLSTLLIVGFVLLFPFMFIKVGDFNPFWCFIPFIIGILIVIFIDKKNVIHICKKQGNTVSLPYSADKAIKNYLMPKFLKLFGDFEWEVGIVNEMLQSNLKYIKSLKLLNIPLAFIDEYIIGTYKNINVKMLDTNAPLILVPCFILADAVILFLLTPIIIIASFFIPFLTFLLFLIVPFWLISLFIGWKFIYATAFRGLIVKFDMNKDFEGHTFILEKGNPGNKLAAMDPKYQQVKLEDIDFMNKYCIYSENQIEARYILTTAFLERFKTIQEKYKAKYIRAAFKDNKIILLIQTGRDMFKMADDSKLSKENFIQLFNEICSVLDLIDELKLNQKLGL